MKKRIKKKLKKIKKSIKKNTRKTVKKLKKVKAQKGTKAMLREAWADFTYGVYDKRKIKRLKNFRLHL